MIDFRRILTIAFGILFGGILYVALNWIPIIGPIAVGFMVGHMIKQNPGIGFKAGIYSACLGVIILAILFANTGLFNFSGAGIILVLLAIWILFIWNLVGILLAGLGGIVGSITGQTQRIFEGILPGLAGLPFGVSFNMPKAKRVLRLEAPPLDKQEDIKPANEEKKMKFVICPNCGSSNPESNNVCENCKQNLK